MSVEISADPEYYKALTSYPPFPVSLSEQVMNHLSNILSMDTEKSSASYCLWHSVFSQLTKHDMYFLQLISLLL